jgi:hypothetical protein
MKTADLYAREVQRLEDKRKDELVALKIKIKTGYDYIQPVNVLKRTLSKAVKSPEIQGDLLMIGINMATSLLTKKLVKGKSNSAIKTWIASFLESTIHKLASKNGDSIKLYIEKGLLSLLEKINFKKAPSQSEEKDETKDHLSKSAA